MKTYLTRVIPTIVLFCAAAIATPSSALVLGDIVTKAGGGGGDNAAATAGSLGPVSVAVDSSGNIYIADTSNNRIRKVTASTGIISNIAGNGSYGFSGDGGLATAASLNNPKGLAVDRSGNLYIADSYNYRVRKVAAATGIISTVVGNGSNSYSGDGGNALSASISAFSGVTVDNAGNIFIADTYNNRIRKVNVSTGIITTVAGNGTAYFGGDDGAATLAYLYGPEGVTIDSGGNLFIADTLNNRIRKVAVSTGLITTVAGNGTTTFTGDGAAATDAGLNEPSSVRFDSDGNLYIADTKHNRIRKVSGTTGIITTVAGSGSATAPGLASGDNGDATAATLGWPEDLTLDSYGNLYITDTNSRRIRKVAAATGIITTVAGNGSAAFAGDNGAATDASLYNPTGVVVDSAGNFYVADPYNNRIRKVTATTGIITTVAGNGASAFAGDNGAATDAGLKYPLRVTIDSSGNLYIADTNNHRIRKVNAATGIITTIAGNGTAAFAGDNGAAVNASLSGPNGVAVDSSGNIYIADNGNNRVRKVTAATGIITTVAGNGTAAFAGDDGLATAASLYSPNCVSFDSADNLYIADANNNRVRKVTAATGIITTVAGNGDPLSSFFYGDGGPATAASLYMPGCTAIDGSGNLFIADTQHFRIRKVAAATGIISTVAGNGTPPFSGDNGAATSAAIYAPSAVALDRDGNLYIADTNNGRLRKVFLNPVQPYTAVTSSSTGNASPNGAAVTFTAKVTSSEIIPADSSITFTDGATILETALLDNNQQASVTVSSLSVGSHPIRAIFPPIGILGESTSPELVHTVFDLPVVVTGFASNVTKNSAILRGTVNDNSATTNVSFDYGLTTDYGSSVSGGTVPAGFGVNDVNAAISGLICDTVYHFRAVGLNSAGTTNGNDMTFTTVACNAASLNVSILGNGGGSVNSDPSGIACVSGSSSGCSATFANGSQVTLTALADWKSSFEGWSAPCSGKNACVINLEGDIGVAATFIIIPRVQIPGPTPTHYATLHDAYVHASDGDTLKISVYSFTENLLLDKAITVYFNGGMDSNYLDFIDFTTLIGSLAIEKGSAVINRLIIE